MKSPRGSPRNLDAATHPPSPPAQPAASVDLLSFQKHRTEGLIKFGSLTQDVIQTINSTMKNAVAAGQTKARVQTLFLAQHYSYSRVVPYPKSSLTIYNDQTLEPMKNCATRINLAARPRELTEWLQEQGVHFICTALCVQKDGVFGEPVLAPHIYIVALFVPSIAKEDERLVWNTVFAQKDVSAVDVWQARCVNAVRVGATSVVLMVLYAGVDFGVAEPAARSAAGSAPSIASNSPARSAGEFECPFPRLYPTNAPAPYTLCLNARFKTVIEWTASIGYTWTCLVDDSSDPPGWAYFVMNLSPMKYLQ